MSVRHTAENSDSTITTALARELDVSEAQVQATVGLLDEGNTVPFIARYRKEVTGGYGRFAAADLGNQVAVSA
jgi:uncharacterized protein